MNYKTSSIPKNIKANDYFDNINMYNVLNHDSQLGDVLPESTEKKNGLKKNRWFNQEQIRRFNPNSSEEETQNI